MKKTMLWTLLHTAGLAVAVVPLGGCDQDDRPLRTGGATGKAHIAEVRRIANTRLANCEDFALPAGGNLTGPTSLTSPTTATALGPLLQHHFAAYERFTRETESSQRRRPALLARENGDVGGDFDGKAAENRMPTSTDAATNVSVPVLALAAADAATGVACDADGIPLHTARVQQ